jgi:hypothetical protein
VLETVNALSQEVRSFVQQSKQWQNELMQSCQQLRQVMQTVAAIPAPAPQQSTQQAPFVNARPFRGISMADEDRTQTGISICGRCNCHGHGRANCKRQTVTCRECGQYGRIGAECEAPQGGYGRPRSSSFTRRPRECLFCHKEGHFVAEVHDIAALRDQQQASPVSGAPRQ